MSWRCVLALAAVLPLTTPASGASGDAALAVPEVCARAPLAAPLDVLEAVERALCHHPQTRQAWAGVMAQAARLETARAAYLPAATASIGAFKGNSSRAISGRPQLDSRQNSDTRAASVDLSWTLYDFGQRRAGVEQARALLEAAGATRDATLQSVFAAAAQAYYDLLSAQGALAAARDAEQAARESALAAAARHQAGAASLSDKLQAQTAAAQAVLSRVRAEGEAQNAAGTLAAAMGMSVATPLTLAAGPTSLPGTAFVQSVAVLLEQAKRAHPSVRAAQAQLQAAQQGVAAARADGMPTLSLSASVERNRQSSESQADADARSKSIGLQLRIPLLAGWSRAAGVHAAQAARDAKAAELAQTEQDVALELWKNYQGLGTETESLKASEELLQSAAQSADVVRGRYKAGVGNLLELLNAQSALADARQQRVQATSRWHSARLKLAASLGQLGYWAVR
ncbi:TolC family protein [Janthinobacterium fluminis]|uniref:Protein CyaE n=1 Tax=Janthinobacterium fluminis TaxID=2987524 RepID=A0ABT5JVP9_9BURK|nr:TolC family protein [Janthinobacterium fluminis]MDC8756789.1 TolC family protein [Janthinobacterium fluminis]